MIRFNKLVLALFIFAFPFALFYILFGLSGSSFKHYVVIGIGYLLTITSALPLFSRTKIRYGPLLGIFLVAVGIHLDSKFWRNHKVNLCLELRSHASCVEDQSGFYCSDWGGEGIGFSTSKSICDGVTTN